MENCLLCLSEVELFIIIDSLQWREFQVKDIINKHLWSMEYILPTSGVCNKCWQELFGFHKFFNDIQAAHNKLEIINSLKYVVREEELKNITDMQLEQEIIKHSNEFDVEETKNVIKQEHCTTDPLTEHDEEKPTAVINKCLSKNTALLKTETDNSYECDLVNNSVESTALRNCDSDSESVENKEITTESSIKNSKIDDKDRFIAENFKITCCLCQKIMKTFHELCQHFKIQHKVRGYVTCCNKKIFRRCYLLDHINFHLNPDYFKCSQCGKVLADRLCLKSHLKTHEDNLAKNHCCDICGKSFMCNSKLKIHKTTHLPEEEKQFSCSECGKKFANKYLLSNHVHAVHLKVYAKICDICGKSLSSTDDLERHMLDHEGKPAPTFSCDMCGLILTSMKGLKRHKNTIHPVGGHQEYTCAICSKISSNIMAHKRHVKFSHIMGYDHKCKICEKAFKKPRTLKEHMATHTGTVLYTCTWCPKTFNSNANMHSHRKKMHPVEWLEATSKKYSGNLLPKK